MKIVIDAQTLKAGLEKQSAGSVYIKEGIEERLQKGVLEISIGSEIAPEECQTYIEQAVPEVSVVKGDLKIKHIGISKEKSNTYLIEIIEQSTVPSAIAISYPSVKLTRNCPEWHFGLKLLGIALDKKEIIVKDFFIVRTPNTYD